MPWNTKHIAGDLEEPFALLELNWKGNADSPLLSEVEPHKVLINVQDVTGFKWDVVFVFDGAIPTWAEKLVDKGYWIPLSWGGFDNAIGFSR